MISEVKKNIFSHIKFHVLKLVHFKDEMVHLFFKEKVPKKTFKLLKINYNELLYTKNYILNMNVK